MPGNVNTAKEFISLSCSLIIAHSVAISRLVLRTAFPAKNAAHFISPLKRQQMCENNVLDINND